MPESETPHLAKSLTPPEGYEWLYHIIQRVEAMHDATVGEHSPNRLMQKDMSELLGKANKLLDQAAVFFDSEKGPLRDLRVEMKDEIGGLRDVVVKLHGDYTGLHNLTMRTNERNETNWNALRNEFNNLRSTVDGKLSEFRQELSAVKSEKDSQIASIKGEILALHGRMDGVVAKAG